MFAPYFDQAYGLQGWDLQPRTRVIPVAASDSSTLSLELVWQLEHALSAQGHPVEVVDSLRGLDTRAAASGHVAVLQRWLRGIPQGSVVVLHAPMEALAVLLADSTARPLVAMGADRRAVVQAYNTIKVLVQVGELEPVVVPMGDPDQVKVLSKAARALRDACEHRLDTSVSVWPLEYHESNIKDTRLSAQEACMLKVLDSALVMDAAAVHMEPPTRSTTRMPRQDQPLGAADVHRQRHA